MRHSQSQKPAARHHQKQNPKQNQRQGRYRKEAPAPARRASSASARKSKPAVDARRASAPANARTQAPSRAKAQPKPKYPSNVRTSSNRAKVQPKAIYPSNVRTKADSRASSKSSSSKKIVNIVAIIAAAAAVIVVMVLILTTVFSTVEMKPLAQPVEVVLTEPMKAAIDERPLSAPVDDEGHFTVAGVAPTEGEEAPALTKDTIPAITGLERVSESSDGIVLKWDDIPGVDGYHIYRQDLTAEDPSYRPFATIEKQGLDIRNLTTGCKYGFKIAPFIKSGGATYEGEAVEVSFSTIPASVENFRMTDATKTTTSMAWDKNDRADGYVLQRCESGKWSDYQTFGADTTEFTDEGLKPNKAYYYRLCSYREDSTGKLLGETAVIYTVAGLLGPEDDGSASKLGRVSLDYEESDYATGYKIYYSKDQEDWEELTDTDSTHYSTSRLENGETYYFRIYPYKEVDAYKITGTCTELDFVANTEIYDKEVGDTYVEVSLDDQHMWYIVDGDVYIDSDCVTGNYGSADTPKGYFEVNAKASPCTLKGDDYVSYVTYWMPFIGGGWGLHDATWRSSFGGSIYKGGGSHGCVNLPYDVAEKMYEVIEVGTPVIVY